MSDIGESLIASWLRHVKKCQIVQTNWTVDQEIEDDSTGLLKEAQDFFKNKFKKSDNEGYDIFPNKDIDYVIKQAECDAVGIDFINKIYYGVDIAFHSNKLGYGNSQENIKKIIEKSLRTALCFYNVLDILDNDDIKVSIIFATPKMSKNEEKIVKSALESLQRLFNSNGKKVTFDNYGNEKFYNMILHPLLEGENLFKYKDYNELFIRSIQLYELSTNFANKKTKNKKKQIDITLPLDTLPSEEDMKVGKYARTELINYLKNNDIELKPLLDKKGTKDNNFNIGYPLLMEEEPEGNYRDRYYREPFIIKDKPYYLCNNWKKTNKDEINTFIGKTKT